MKKGIFVVVFLVLSLGFVAAHGVYWNMDGGKVLSYKKFSVVEFDDYRYDRVKYVKDSYDDRWEGKDWEWKKGFDERDRKKAWDGKSWDKRGKDYYYKFIPYLKKYERIGCYHSAPEGKFLYRKCPSSYW